MTVKVTEADRGAVREHARNKWRGETIEEAFARHRQQALEEAARVADEQARRAWVIAKELGQNGVCASGRNYGARDVAQAIRSLIGGIS